MSAFPDVTFLLNRVLKARSEHPLHIQLLYFVSSPANSIL